MRATEPIERLDAYKGRFVSPVQLAPYWGVQAATVVGWLRCRRLKGAKIGRRWRVRVEDALRFEQSLFDGDLEA